MPGYIIDAEIGFLWSVFHIGDICVLLGPPCGCYRWDCVRAVGAIWHLFIGLGLDRDKTKY